MSGVDEARRRRNAKLKVTRQRQNLVLGAAVLGAVLILALAYFIVNSDIWLLKTVSVTGNKRVSAARVSRLARVDEKSNLLKISAREVETRLKNDPWIAGAAVSKSLPNRLGIDIKEREPFACVKKGGQLYIFDKTGFVVDATSTIEDKIPVINGVKIRDIKVGSRFKDGVLANAVKSLRGLAPDLRARIIWVSVPSLDKLAFQTRDDVEIIFGSAKEAAKKNYVIKKILADHGDQVIHINVTAPDNPVVRKL